MKFELTLALVILGPFIPVLVFYILDKFFKLKIKLIKLFRSTDGYKKTMLAISFTSYMSVAIFLFLTDNGHLINLSFSIILLYHYLIRIPEELR